MGEQADRLARGEWYLDDEELQRRRRACWIQLDSFNSARADDDATRARVLLNLMRSVGERAMVMPRFTIGEHARIGPGAQLMTALHAFFMDDALITRSTSINAGARAGSERRP